MVKTSIRVPAALVKRLIDADAKQKGWTIVLQDLAEAELDRQERRK